METIHGISITSYKDIWLGIKEYHDCKKAEHEKKKTIKKLKRTVFLKHFKPILKEIKEDTDTKFETIFNTSIKSKYGVITRN